jgi:hypothetical protein
MSGRDVVLKLVSELTSEDLRDYDIVYIGFLRSMGLLREYYFSKSRFQSEPPFLNLTSAASGVSFERAGPVPGNNTDYALFASLKGPADNAMIIMTGISDVGVLASTRFFSSRDGAGQIEEILTSPDTPYNDVGGFEVLLEVKGHSRTDLDYTLVGTYVLSN